MRNKVDGWHYDNVSERCWVEYDPRGHLAPGDSDGKKNDDQGLSAQLWCPTGNLPESSSRLLSISITAHDKLYQTESPLRAISSYNHNLESWLRQSLPPGAQFVHSLHCRFPTHTVYVFLSTIEINKPSKKANQSHIVNVSFRLIDDTFESKLGRCSMQWGNLLVLISSSPSNW